MVVMGKKLAVGVIAVVVVIALVLVGSGVLDPIISQITKEPHLSISETHGEDWFRAEIHIYVTNDGGASASGVTVTVGSNGNSKTQSLGDIAIEQTKTADFTFILARGGDYLYQATATCLEGSFDAITFTVHVSGI